MTGILSRSVHYHVHSSLSNMHIMLLSKGERFFIRRNSTLYPILVVSLIFLVLCGSLCPNYISLRGKSAPLADHANASTQRTVMSLRQWQQTVKDPSSLIIQASSRAMDDGWQPYPIGMSYRFLDGKYPGERLMNASSWQMGSHDKLVLCALSDHTDQRRRASPPNRRSILESLGANGIANRQIEHDEYFATLALHKFVLSPEGNGIDCHRHYEALLAGCIPVVEMNEGIQAKYGNCPILYTSAFYSEITPQYLESKYTEMLDQEFDFSALLLPHYNISTQDTIKADGDFWCEHLLGRPCYSTVKASQDMN